MKRLWMDPSEHEYACEISLQCDHCGDDILRGENYYEIGDDRVCEDCFDEYLEELKSDAQREA